MASDCSDQLKKILKLSEKPQSRIFLKPIACTQYIWNNKFFLVKKYKTHDFQLQSYNRIFESYYLTLNILANRIQNFI